MRGRTAQEIATTARAEMKRRRDHLLALVRHLDAIIEAAPDILTLDERVVGVLRDRRVGMQELAARIRGQLQSRSWFYFGLLQEAENAGVDLGYTSVPKPHGAGITYLVAAAAKHGRPIGPDRAASLIKTFKALPRLRAKLAGEGMMRVDAHILRRGQLIDE